MKTVPKWTLAILLFCSAALGGCATNEPSSIASPSADLLPVRCLEEPGLASGEGRQIGYVYDYRDNRCKPFRYAGGTAKAAFETQSECIATCVAGATDVDREAPDSQRDAGLLGLDL